MHIDHNYEHAILDIRKRLHDPRGSKAAVMVGAGFSRNAIPRSTSSILFPLWQDLTIRLAEHLYPNLDDRQKVLDRAGATSSALRLAQEFETAFGRSRLTEFLRDFLRDDEFLPSTLHSELLELPWADVFTTNYDRFLEIAALSLWKQHYETVYGVNDLPLARRPRIVKLHGSLPELAGLVLTEDDYRTYLNRYAPFVAAVQAALTENVLCLIGFSGDDPNFLAWSGWLRDELQEAVPKTYLFTRDELQPFQRQLLESRHIIPIPLKRIAGTNDYESACHWLFAKLAQRPEAPTPAWNIVPQYVTTRDDASIAPEPLSPSSADWIDTAILWRQHRLQFKGWCALHREGIKRLETFTEFWRKSLSVPLVSEWPAPTSLFILSEVIWRNSTALQPLPDEFVFKVLDPQLARFTEWRHGRTEVSYRVSGKTQSVDLSLGEIDDAYYSLLKECLRHAREIGDNDRFQRFLGELTEAFPQPAASQFNDHHSFLRYQRVLHLLGALHQVEARELLQSWNPTASDLIWSIRRAGLCLEAGLISLGVRLLEATLAKLRSVPVSASLDIHRMSAEGITLNLLWATRSNERLGTAPSEDTAGNTSDDDSNPRLVPPEKVILDRLTELGSYGCDANDTLEWLQIATSPDPKTTKGTLERESFDIGYVASKISFGSEPQLKLAYRAMRFIEDTGLPLRIPNVITTSVASTLFQNATRTIAFFAPHEAVGLVIRSRDEKLVEAILSRNCLAQLVESQIDWLYAAATSALREALDQLEMKPATRQMDDEFWENQFRVACAILSHVVVRLNDEQVGSILCELAAIPQHPKIRDRFQCHDVLATCIRRAAKSLSRASIPDLLLKMLEVPMPDDSTLPKSLKWFDPVSIIASFSNRLPVAASADCKERIDGVLLSIADARGDVRERLCARAVALLDGAQLTSEQRELLASSLFAYCDDCGLPADTGVLDSLILSLPAEKDVDEIGAFRAKHLSDTNPDPERWAELCGTNVAVPEVEENQRRSIGWTPDDIDTLLEFAKEWLDSASARSDEEQVDSDSKRFWLAAVGLRDDEKRAYLILYHWLATLEDIVLLNSGASEEQRSRANDLVRRADKLGFCVTRTVATRVFLGKLVGNDAIAEIRRRLTDRKQGNVRQACDAIIRWCELSKRGEFVMPVELLQSITTLIESRRHDFLPTLIATGTRILELLEEAERVAFWNRIQSGMNDLLLETKYQIEGGQDFYTIDMKLRIRIECARMVTKANALGLSSPTVDEWIDSINDDVFADVRRESVADAKLS